MNTFFEVKVWVEDSTHTFGPYLDSTQATTIMFDWLQTLLSALYPGSEIKFKAELQEFIIVESTKVKIRTLISSEN